MHRVCFLPGFHDARLTAAAIAALIFVSTPLGHGPAQAQQKADAPATSVLEQVEECDVLAAHPADPQRMAEGVDDDDIVPRLAIMACEDAAKRHPDDPRFAFQLGRATLAKGDKEGSLKLFQDAAKNGHAAAYGYIGDAHQFGHGVPVDPAAAYENYKKAVELGFAVAERQLEQLNFDPDLFAVSHVNALFTSEVERIRTASGDGERGPIVRNYLFSFTQALMDECEHVIEPANVVGYYVYRYGGDTASDSDEKIAVAIQSPIAQHDAKTFLRRYGCEGPVAKHIFANLNTLFSAYRQR